MLLNAATIAAIVAACWAHPSGQAYLSKIDQIEAYANACGNPCCKKPVGVGGKHVKRILVERVESLGDLVGIDYYQLAALRPMPETGAFTVGQREPIYTPPELYITTPAEIESIFRSNLEAMRAAAPKLAEQIESEAAAEEEAVIHLMNWMME